MKKLSMAIIAASVSTLIHAQKINEKEVPQAIKTAFQKAYPTAREIKWEKENGNYEAEFDYNKNEYSVLYDANGQLLETEMEIEINQLPPAAVKYVEEHYKGQKIKEAAKITDAKGNITYEAEIKGADLIFDNKGNFIKEIKK